MPEPVIIGKTTIESRGQSLLGCPALWAKNVAVGGTGKTRSSRPAETANNSSGMKAGGDAGADAIIIPHNGFPSRLPEKESIAICADFHQENRAISLRGARASLSTARRLFPSGWSPEIHPVAAHPENS